MKNLDQYRQSDRLLVVMPSWVGDVVMAMPTLRALRTYYTKARITVLVRSTVRPLLDPCPWIDRFATVKPQVKGRQRGNHRGIFNLSIRLAAGKFDTAVLLPNSFRSALLTMTAGIPRRVGYDRDGRGFLLTDRLLPRRQQGTFVPVPMRDYYLGLARYLGATVIDPTMQLFTRPEFDEATDRLLLNAGVEASRRPFVLIAPGANYGDAKLWQHDRFAEVADRCSTKLGAVVAVSGAPKERAIVERVVAAAREPVIDLMAHGIDLVLLKSVIRRSNLVITNDTGPRHMAAAMGVPVVTIFGPTDPAWTEIGYGDERQLQVSVECGPCQLKKCPLDHRCMKLIDSEMVFAKVAELLRPVKASV